MNDHPRHPAPDEELDDVLAMLRDEPPAESMRHDAVWARVEARSAHAVSPVRGVHSRRRWLAAAMVAGLVAGGALLRQLAGPQRKPEGPGGPSRPVLVDAARILDAAVAAQPGTAAADTLRVHGALLLASTRALIDVSSPDAAAGPEIILRDVEYALAQLVQGGLSDPVEHELAARSIVSRRVVARALEGGS